MKRLWIALAVAIYVATGFFVVPANEKAVVRRFGRVILPPRSSGLHFDWPWPGCRIDRVNVNEIRTLTIGDLEADPAFIQPTSSAQVMTFLTGDKNLLLLRITVQYRVSEANIVDWLYGSQTPILRLQTLVEAAASDLVLRSGVDFVHTFGLAELNNRLLRDVRQQAAILRLGCEIEQVTIDRAEPPARVKAEFLDVSNARADMARSIHEAKSYSEQKRAGSEADAKKISDVVERDRQAKISAARGSADRFDRLVAQIALDATTGNRSYEASRRLVMNRLTLESIRDVLASAKLKIMLDSDKPVDLAIPK